MSQTRLFSSIGALLTAFSVAHFARAATPAVANPGFDQDNTGVASPAGWTSSGSTDADFTEWGGHNAAFRLSHWSASAYSVETSQKIDGLSPGWYTLRGWVRRSTGNNNSYLELRCGREPARVYLPVAWASQWLQIVVSTPVVHRSCTIVLHTDADGGEWSNFDDIELVPGASYLSVFGADVSSLHKSEDFGGKYFDDQPGCGFSFFDDDDDDDDHDRGGFSSWLGHFGRGRHHRSDPALRILANHGANNIRLRVWVNPADGYHDKAEAVEMARRARFAGLGVLVDLHYSDSWADPGQQNKPAAWASYSVEQLRQAIYDHTYDVCTSIKAHAGAPEMIQIGNELNSGMLWPDGHTWNPPNWDNLASFLKAGHDAVKACSPSTKVVLHLGNGNDNGLYRWWFDNITSRGVDFDVIAASYYGYWHGSLGDLQWNLNDVSARYGKDVLVAETAYPFTLADKDGFFNQIGTPGQLVAGYDATPAGQARNFRDVLSIVRAVPNGRGLGAFYWDATWTAVPGNGWDPTDPTSGNSWENQAMFDFDDRALPAMDEFRP